jgi:bidirectional [NiFe] hydrogenase diaphorase subunit
MEFCMDESCGKCVPCRVGTLQMHRLLERITQGTATPADLDTLQDLCTMVKETSLCGLGQSAPNPVLSTIRYFLDEYIAHIRDHRCSAGVCDLDQQPITELVHRTAELSAFVPPLTAAANGVQADAVQA